MKSLLAIALLLPNLAFAEQTCENSSPVDFAKNFLKKHKNFYFEETQGLKQQVNPLLYKTLKSHYQCAVKQGICHFDYDPWTGAQDGDLVESSVNFATKQVTPALSRVTMTYQFSLQAGQAGQSQNVQLIVHTAAAPVCWQLTDMITPKGDSLQKLLLQKPGK
jgi:hypothetical protein